MHPADEFLMHYGVVGMKWGKRAGGSVAAKSTRSSRKIEPRNPEYTKRMQDNDRHVLGKAGSDRVNSQMNKGVARKDAYTKEFGRQQRNAVIAIGATTAAVRYGPAIMFTIGEVAQVGKQVGYMSMNQATKAKGKKAAANLFAQEKGITNYNTVRLAFDEASNSWG